MKNVVLAPPALGFIIATRAALAAGVGLLVSEKLPQGRRRALGAALVAIGAATTIPALMFLRRGGRKPNAGSTVEHDDRLIGATRFPRKGDDLL